jgi:hypothetical protein
MACLHELTSVKTSEVTGIVAQNDVLTGMDD